jgi:hypothetical protein
MRSNFVHLLLFFLLLIGAPTSSSAQIFESVGIRAQGMGGAFVAVVDDATATWWNPPGIAGGAMLSVIVEAGRTQDPHDERDPEGFAVPAWRGEQRVFAAAYPALGVSYYRLRVSEIQPISSTATGGGSRQDQGLAPALERSLLVNQFGVTFAQSMGRHFIVGSTLKLLRGSVASVTSDTASASLDEASSLEGSGETHTGLDVGVLGTFGVARLALAVRNLSQPTFGEGADAVRLKRQVRAGIAAKGSIVTVSFDADFTRTPTAVGDARHVAGGAETRLFKQRVALRGGFSANTVDAARTAASAGIGIGVGSRLFVDGAITGGSDQTRKGWGVDLRVMY